MKRLLRTRIRGVSFHTQKPGPGSGRPVAPGTGRPGHGRNDPRGLFHEDAGLARVAEAIARGDETPAPFGRTDVQRLLGDFGRQELHTLVSDAIDAIIRWKQLSETLEKLAGPDSESRIWQERELDVVLGARRTQHLWRHRLDILEMIADAQRSLLVVARKGRR